MKMDNLPYDLRERIAFVAIAIRMRDVYRTAIYNATVLQNVRFDQRLSSASFCARHPRIALSSLVPSSLTGLDSHGLAWLRFPREVVLVPLGFEIKPSYRFDVSVDGILETTPFRADVVMSVKDADGARLNGRVAVTAYAQAKYERALRGVVHYQAVEIQRMYRGALARRGCALGEPTF